MNTVNEILDQVNEIFKDVLENKNIVVSEKTVAEDIAEWDSFSHIQLVVAIERHFNIRFISSEIHGFKNVGEMCEGILKKTTNK